MLYALLDTPAAQHVFNEWKKANSETFALPTEFVNGRSENTGVERAITLKQGDGCAICGNVTNFYAATTIGDSERVIMIQLPVCLEHLDEAKSYPSVFSFFASLFHLSIDINSLEKSPNIPDEIDSNHSLDSGCGVSRANRQRMQARKGMASLDVALLLKLAMQNEPLVPSKDLAESLFISSSEVSKSLKRSVESGLLHMVNGEKRVNRSALLEFLVHGFKYVFPPAKGSLVRGVRTATAAEPLKSRFLDSGDPPDVWPCAEGTVRGIAFVPLYKGAPKAALKDARFYGVLALCDAIRGGRTRERNLAIELLEKEFHA